MALRDVGAMEPVAAVEVSSPRLHKHFVLFWSSMPLASLPTTCTRSFVSSLVICSCEHTRYLSSGSKNLTLLKPESITLGPCLW